ncbi:MAG TPA: ABC transporter permease [Bacillota bacterium]|jgi:peptide/nickel transport system permease protein
MIGRFDLNRPRPGRPAGAPFQLGRRRCLNLVVGLILVSIVLALAGLGAVWTPHDPERMDLSERAAPPSLNHPFGTDQFGRDALSRVLKGAGSAVQVGLGVAAIAAALGVILGAAGGFRGGPLDEFLMRFIDGLYAFPPLIMALALVAALGPGLHQVTVAIGLAEVPAFARLTRSLVITLRKQLYIEAAKSIGAGDWQIVRTHLLPNAAPALFVQASIAFSTAVLAEAALSFLGLGVQPPAASWGLMLQEAQNFLYQAPWMAIFPGLLIALTILGFNLLADGLAERSDPRLR